MSYKVWIEIEELDADGEPFHSRVGMPLDVSASSLEDAEALQQRAYQVLVQTPDYCYVNAARGFTHILPYTNVRYVAIRDDVTTVYMSCGGAWDLVGDKAKQFVEEYLAWLRKQ